MSFVGKKIKKILKDREIDYKEHDHEPVYTCEVADKVRKRIERGEKDNYKKGGIKNLLFETREGNFIMVLGPGNQEIDEKKIKELEDTKAMRLARPKDVEKVVGCKIGCVPPFGHKRKIKTYLNKELLGYDYLYFNPGNHSKTIKIKAKDLPKLIEDPIIYE